MKHVKMKSYAHNYPQTVYNCGFVKNIPHISTVLYNHTKINKGFQSNIKNYPQ